MRTLLQKIQKKLPADRQGFTIIEILIVLAIAGLILTIVFLAVPQLQRNARDNKRQNVATRLSSELGTYSGNNQGAYPFVGVNAAYAACAYSANPTAQSCSDWYSRYLCSAVACTGANKLVDIFDPSGTLMTINIGANAITAANWATATAWITVGASCNGEFAGAGTASSTSKKFAVTIALERTGTFFCVDNG